MKHFEVVDKRFLSSMSGEGGSSVWDVQAHQSRRRGTTNISADVRMTDCYKSITLEFYSSTPKMFHQRIDKLDSLIESLEMFKDSLKQARLENVKKILEYRKDNRGTRFSKDSSDNPSRDCLICGE